jgi:hypothetical protein
MSGSTGLGSEGESDGESRVGDGEERLDGRSAFLLSCIEVVEKNSQRAWPIKNSIKAHSTAEFKLLVHSLGSGTLFPCRSRNLP